MRQHDLEVKIIQLNDKIMLATYPINDLIEKGINNDDTAKKELEAALKERTRLQMEATQLYDALYSETEYAQEWEKERVEWLKTVERLKKQDEVTDKQPYLNVKLGLRRIDKYGKIIRNEGKIIDILHKMIDLCGGYERHSYFTHLGDGWFLRMTQSHYLQLGRIDRSEILNCESYPYPKGIRIKDGKIYVGTFSKGQKSSKKNYTMIAVDNDEVIEVFKEEFQKGLKAMFKLMEAQEVKDSSFGEGFDIISHRLKVEDYEFFMNNAGKKRGIIIPNDL